MHLAYWKTTSFTNGVDEIRKSAKIKSVYSSKPASRQPHGPDPELHTVVQN